GYSPSLLANFYPSASLTLGRNPPLRKAFGFGGAHLCSYLLHMGLLNLSLWMGIPKPLAPIPVFAIAIPVNFLLVRFVFKRKE
uniref:GtrA family protein n=1 Tax=Bacteroides eggerthii TaxID=28111 RepID=UPI003FF0939F